MKADEQRTLNWEEILEVVERLILRFALLLLLLIKLGKLVWAEADL